MRCVLLLFLSLPLLAARQPAEVRRILQDRDQINAASFNDPTQLINDTLLDRLFDDGFSTAESISESSGRGIGLAAIRSFCRKHGGDAAIIPKKGNQGIILRATFSLDSTIVCPQTAA